MEHKNKAVLEVKKDEKIYSFHCDVDSSLGAVLDALSEMRHFVVQKINENIPPTEEKKPEECEEKNGEAVQEAI